MPTRDKLSFTLAVIFETFGMRVSAYSNTSGKITLHARRSHNGARTCQDVYGTPFIQNVMDVIEARSEGNEFVCWIINGQCVDFADRSCVCSLVFTANDDEIISVSCEHLLFTCEHAHHDAAIRRVSAD